MEAREAEIHRSEGRVVVVLEGVVRGVVQGVVALGVEGVVRGVVQEVAALGVAAENN